MTDKICEENLDVVCGTVALSPNFRVHFGGSLLLGYLPLYQFYCTSAQKANTFHVLPVHVD